MSDLEGMDAFNRLLDELLEATRGNAALREERDLAIRSGREAAEIVRTAQDRADRIELETARNIDTLKDQHEAALATSAKLCGVDDLPF